MQTSSVAYKKRRTKSKDGMRERGVSCRCAFIPFIMAGDPDLETTEKALLELDKAGADIIELGVPYSASTPNNLLMKLKSPKSTTALEDPLYNPHDMLLESQANIEGYL